MSRRKWNKYSTQVSIILGLVASVPINLATSWFQQFFSNVFLLIFIVILIIAICYFIRKLSIPLLTTAFWIMVASVCLNLISIWIQDHALHNTFPPSTVLVILLSSIGALTLSALIDPKVLTKFENRMKGKYRRRAKRSSISRAKKRKDREKEASSNEMMTNGFTAVPGASQSAAQQTSRSFRPENLLELFHCEQL